MELSFLIQDQHPDLRFYLAMHLKQKRLELGYSQAEMAVFLDITVRSYQSLEAGKKKMTADQLLLLCDKLNLKFEDLEELFRVGNIAKINSFARVMSPHYPT